MGGFRALRNLFSTMSPNIQSVFGFGARRQKVRTIWAILCNLLPFPGHIVKFKGNKGLFLTRKSGYNSNLTQK